MSFELYILGGLVLLWMFSGNGKKTEQKRVSNNKNMLSDETKKALEKSARYGGEHAKKFIKEKLKPNPEKCKSFLWR